MAIQNKCHIRHKSYTKYLQKANYQSLTYIRPNAESLNHSISNTTPQGPHRRLQYLQLKH
jgi:hypothetical protein